MNYNELFNNVNIPIAVLSDADLKLLFKNKAFNELFLSSVSVNFDSDMLFDILNINLPQLKNSIGFGKSYSQTACVNGIPLYYAEFEPFVSEDNAYVVCTVHCLPLFADGMIFKDSLTGLQNRVGFEYYADKLRTKYGNCDFLLMIIDIDRFKSINDSYGHIFGDEVLAAFAANLKSLQTQDSVCGRFGGDEFIAMHKLESKACAEKIIKEYIRKLNTEYNGVNVCCGIGTAIGNASLTINDMLLTADSELLKNKAENQLQ